MNEKCKKRFEDYKSIIEKNLDKYLIVKKPEMIWESMRYSVLNGGKRLRSVITLELCNALSDGYEQAVPTACAIEMMHSYSLIHDDLPCMDNDDYRRGKLTNHKVYGEAVALLAGDSLISFAPQVILQYTPKSVKKETILQIIEEYLMTAGAEGIVVGQVVDIQSEGKEVQSKTLSYIHKYKTGALFKYAFRAGALLGNASDNTLKNITEISEKTGLAFQIADDILDVISTRAALGKTPGKDAIAEKMTFVTLYGLAEAKRQLDCLTDEICGTIRTMEIKSELLSAIVESIAAQVR